MSSVAELLKQQDKKIYWQNAPATEAEIQRLKEASPISLPEEYVDLLRLGNGFEAELALLPRLFVLYETFYVVELLQDKPYEEIHNDLFIIGNNGGLETIAFDLRQEPSYAIVMVDLIGGIDTVVTIAPDLPTFISAIGLCYPDANDK